MVLVILLAIISGMALSAQAAINGKLGAKVGVIQSSFLTFGVGTIVTALLIFFFEPAQSATLLSVPKWQLTGALFGIVYMVVMVASGRIARHVQGRIAVIGRLAITRVERGDFHDQRVRVRVIVDAL